MSTGDPSNVTTDGTSTPTTPSDPSEHFILWFPCYIYLSICVLLVLNLELSMVYHSLETTNSDGSQDDTSESFAFALVNGALGVFEVHGRRIRDFR